MWAIWEMYGSSFAPTQYSTKVPFWLIKKLDCFANNYLNEAHYQ
jgi:hypothetical protein